MRQPDANWLTLVSSINLLIRNTVPFACLKAGYYRAFVNFARENKFMKKGLFLIGIVVAALAVYAVFFSKPAETAGGDEAKQQPLAQSKNSEAFNKPFNAALKAYFNLHDALVNWDTAKATESAKLLQTSLAQVPYDSLKADSNLILTAKTFSGNIDADCIGIAGDTSIAEKRKSFYELSENLYTLVQTIKYDQQKIYHVVCPMAFGDDKEGKWITNVDTIINPYLGLKHPKYHAGMINCGSIADTLDYTHK